MVTAAIAGAGYAVGLATMINIKTKVTICWGNWIVGISFSDKEMRHIINGWMFIIHLLPISIVFETNNN